MKSISCQFLLELGFHQSPKPNFFNYYNDGCFCHYNNKSGFLHILFSGVSSHLFYNVSSPSEFVSLLVKFGVLEGYED